MGSLTNLKTNKTFFVPCECKNQVLSVQYDHHTDKTDFVIYENQESYRNKLSLWQRLRYCYQILVHKKPYIDSMTLDKSQLKDLEKFLNTLDL